MQSTVVAVYVWWQLTRAHYTCTLCKLEHTMCKHLASSASCWGYLSCIANQSVQLYVINQAQALPLTACPYVAAAVKLQHTSHHTYMLLSSRQESGQHVPHTLRAVPTCVQGCTKDVARPWPCQVVPKLTHFLTHTGLQCLPEASIAARLSLHVYKHACLITFTSYCAILIQHSFCCLYFHHAVLSVLHAVCYAAYQRRPMPILRLYEPMLCLACQICPATCAL